MVQGASFAVTATQSAHRAHRVVRRLKSLARPWVTRCEALAGFISPVSNHQKGMATRALTNS